MVFHEDGHALAARRYGVKTKDITLLPIGGVARLERIPDNPMQELWIALAGPLVNVAIALALFLYLQISRSFEPVSSLGLTHGSFAERVMMANIALVLFNLIPAFPMDGGRVLRAILATRMDRVKATELAARLGQSLAIAFGLIGLFSNTMLIFVALFVWIGAAQELAMVRMESVFAGMAASGAMITDYQTLTPGNNLRDAVQLILKGSQEDFPVVEGKQIVGILRKSDLLAALTESGPETLVSRVMRFEFETIDAREPLESVVPRLQENGLRFLPVVERESLVGMITAENLSELFLIQTAMSQRKSSERERLSSEAA